MHPKWNESQPQPEDATVPGIGTTEIFCNAYISFITLNRQWQPTRCNHNRLLIQAYSAIQAVKTTATHITTNFLDYLVALCEIPTSFLSNNGSQFRRKCSTNLCLLLGVKKRTTTACHLQRNEHIERYKGTLVVQLHFHVVEEQDDW